MQYKLSKMAWGWRMGQQVKAITKDGQQLNGVLLGVGNTSDQLFVECNGQSFRVAPEDCRLAPGGKAAYTFSQIVQFHKDGQILDAPHFDFDALMRSVDPSDHQALLLLYAASERNKAQATIDRMLAPKEESLS